MRTVAENMEKAGAIFDAEVSKARGQGFLIGIAIGVFFGLLA